MKPDTNAGLRLSPTDLASVPPFSGTADLETTLVAPGVDGPCWLDLGDVHDVAEVTLNGERLGGPLLWRPHCVDVTGLLRPGPNELEVRVTATLANMLLERGDTLGVILGQEVHPPTPQPSGLAGPVTLLVET